ncbi:hypothetical protein [Streptomyces sp. NPDC007117]|uniref:hypothetical protein n=1 Tax=Streptomyces sp. NPDC007117 TaxID=3154314 RepID=UPI0033D8B16B
MTLLQDTYLAWDELTHKPGCSSPNWTVDVRTEPGTQRSVVNGTSHGCQLPGCEHTDRYDKTSVRIVCSSCGRARIMSGDADGMRETSTQALGYGQPPRKAGGVWLYPGAPLLFGWGHGEEDEPEGYLVTQTRAARVTVDNVIGAIFKDRGPRRGVKWAATAVPAAEGAYGFGLLRWDRKIEDLRSLTAAAKWVSGQGKDTGNGESTTAPGGVR